MKTSHGNLLILLLALQTLTIMYDVFGKKCGCNG